MHHGYINAPALLILLLLSLLLIKGTSESAKVNAVIVFIKVSIVLVFIAVGWQFINPANHHPYLIPADAPAAQLRDGMFYSYTGFFKHGWGGVLTGAAIVFFAFIGFDAVSTAAQEAKNPSRDMPIGILGSLVICTLLYILFSYVLTGVAPYTDFVKAGREASVAYAIDTYMHCYGFRTGLRRVMVLGRERCGPHPSLEDPRGAVGANFRNICPHRHDRFPGLQDLIDRFFLDDHRSDRLFQLQ